MKNRSPHRFSILSFGPRLAIAAFTFLVISLLAFYVGIPLLIKNLILKETRLLEGTETWEKWTDVKLPIFLKFYIFNVSNVEEAEKGGKFRLEEVGPYVWEEKRTKQIVAIDEEEDTVSYKEVVRFYFRPDLSVGSDEDTLHIVNAPFISAATLIYKLLYSSLANYVLRFFTQTGETFVLRDVKIKELVFDGVELGETYKILADFGVVDLPEEFIDGTFAFYNRKNGTPSKEYKVRRGVKNPEDFGKIVLFDHSPEVTWWTNHSLPKNAEQYCNKINGSDGSIYPPFVSKDQIIRLYADEICRSVHGKFYQEIDFHGIPAYEFRPPLEALKNVLDNPDNGCFCADPGPGLRNFCDSDGALRLFPCKKGTPIILTLPHFYEGAQRFFDEVDGMKPDPLKHQMKIILEPNSGALLELLKRVQIGVEFQRLPHLDAFSSVFEAIVPIFWAEEHAVNDEKGIAELRSRLVTPLEILKILKPAAIGLFSFMFFTGIALTLYNKKSEENTLISYGIGYQ